MEKNTQLKNKIEAGQRISAEEACTLFSWDILELGRLADQRRRLTHPSEEVGFIIDRIINFSNVCEAKCHFCAFHAEANRIEPYEMTDDEIYQRVEELVAAGVRR